MTKNAQEFLERSLGTLSNDYVRALTSYALALTGSSKVHALLAELEKTALKQGTLYLWYSDVSCLIEAFR